jgi:hypothetical protein
VGWEGGGVGFGVVLSGVGALGASCRFLLLSHTLVGFRVIKSKRMISTPGLDDKHTWIG